MYGKKMYHKALQHLLFFVNDERGFIFHISIMAFIAIIGVCIVFTLFIFKIDDIIRSLMSIMAILSIIVFLLLLAFSIFRVKGRKRAEQQRRSNMPRGILKQ